MEFKDLRKRSQYASGLHSYPETVKFTFLTTDVVRKVSVVQVFNPETFNSLGHPTTNGLYDPLMGPWSIQAGLCSTCHLNSEHCPGHYGHIELPLPVFHPMFQRNVIKILKMTCPCCKKFFFSSKKLRLFTLQLQFASLMHFYCRIKQGITKWSVGITPVWLTHSSPTAS